MVGRKKEEEKRQTNAKEKKKGREEEGKGGEEGEEKKGRKRELYKLRRNLTVPTAPELFSSGVEDCGGGAFGRGERKY